MSGNDDRHGGDDGFDDDIHFSDEELEAALDGFEKEFRDSNAAAGEPANDAAADSPADDAGAADSGQAQEADTATAFDDELQGLLGVSVDVLTPRALPDAFRSRVLSEAVPV